MATTIKGKAATKAAVSRPLASVMLADGNGTVASALREAGAAVISTAGKPLTEAVKALAECDGLVIPGGTDVDPSLYGQREHRQTWAGSASRDLREVVLLGAARDLGIPVLGICRGHQVIAVEAGGALQQHVPDVVHHDLHNGHDFEVNTVKGSLVARTLGEHPTVTHLHHQAVERMPKGFTVTARDPYDDTIEAIESIDGRVVGVQFHPEFGRTGQRLFVAFVKAGNRYRRRYRDRARPAVRGAQFYIDRWPVARDRYRDWASTPYTAGGWRPSGTTATKAKAKTPAKVTFQAPPTHARVSAEDLAEDLNVAIPGDGVAAICGACGVTFDRATDYYDHVEFVHAGLG